MGFKSSYTFLGVDKITNVTKKVARSVDRLAEKFRGLDEKTAKASRTAANTSRTTALISPKLLKIGAAALVVKSGFSSIIKEGSRFQNSMSDVEAITGATGKDLKFFSNSAIDLSKKWGTSASEIGNAIANIASGKSELLETPDALVDVTDKVLMLSKAARIDAAQAGSAVVTSLNQWGASAKDTSKFIEILAVGSKIGSSRISETVQALKNVGGVAAQAGLSFGETNAALQVMSRGGFKAAEAGTGLRGVLSKLKKAGAGELLKEKGLAHVLELVAEKGWDGVKMLDFFGEEHEKVALALLNGVPLLKEWSHEISTQEDAARQASTAMKTYDGKLSKLKSVIAGISIKIFEEKEGRGFTKMLDDLTGFFASIDSENIDSLVNSFENLVSVISLFEKPLRAVGSVLKGISLKVSDALEDVTNLPKDFTGMIGRVQSKIDERSDDGGYPGMSGLGFNTAAGIFEGLFEEIRNSSIDLDSGRSLRDAFSFSNNEGGKDLFGVIPIEVDINLKGDTEKVSSVKTKAKSGNLKQKVNMAN